MPKLNFSSKLLKLTIGSLLIVSTLVASPSPVSATLGPCTDDQFIDRFSSSIDTTRWNINDFGGSSPSISGQEVTYSGSPGGVLEWSYAEGPVSGDFRVIITVTSMTQSLMSFSFATGDDSTPRVGFFVDALDPDNLSIFQDNDSDPMTGATDVDVTMPPESSRYPMTLEIERIGDTATLTATFPDPTTPAQETFASYTADATPMIQISNEGSNTIQFDDFGITCAGPSVSADSTTLNLDEADTTASAIDLQPNVQPEGDVTVTLSSQNGEVSISPATLVFSPSNWDTAQTVNVTPIDDTDVEGNHDDAVLISYSSGEPYYQSSSDLELVTISLLDNDSSDDGGNDDGGSDNGGNDNNNGTTTGGTNGLTELPKTSINNYWFYIFGLVLIASGLVVLRLNAGHYHTLLLMLEIKSWISEKQDRGFKDNYQSASHENHRAITQKPGKY